MQKRLECKITGLVQGVMFRDFVKRSAQKLDLTGTVENCPDGSVFVVAEGEEDKLKKFIPILRKGPLISRMVAHIENIEERWGEATGTFPDFQILY
ncbi:MAG: acylphosphatase [Candidatus Yonathbacteria bacterium]|nr:acylphosphatase [Candidatus Yonathbacteria bacterium]